MKERIKEIVGILDANGYGKDCNFLDEDTLDNNNIVRFYSRDYCRNITFKELLQWYLSRLYHNDYLADLEETKEKWDAEAEYAKEQEILYMELVDIYTFYSSRDSKRHKELITKLENLIAEEK